MTVTPGRDTTAEEPHQIAELFRRFLLDRGHAAQVDQVRMLSGGERTMRLPTARITKPLLKQ